MVDYNIKFEKNLHSFAKYALVLKKKLYVRHIVIDTAKICNARYIFMHHILLLCIFYKKKIQEFSMHNCYQPNNCGAMPYTMQPEGYTNSVNCTCYLAMATVPWQQFTSSYEPEKAFRIGTLFPELYNPFLGRGVMRS